MNRLVSGRADGEASADLTYDEVGNRLSLEIEADPNTPSPNDVLSVADSYDAGDQLISETRSSKKKSTVISYRYDDNGNRTRSSAQRLNLKGKPVGKVDNTDYAYNLRSQLVAAGDSTWERDGLGRAMSMSDSKATTQYVYDQSHVIETIGDEARLFVRDESQLLLSQTVGMNPKTEVMLTGLVGSVPTNGISSKIATFADFGQYVGNQHPVGIFISSASPENCTTTPNNASTSWLDPMTRQSGGSCNGIEFAKTSKNRQHSIRTITPSQLQPPTPTTLATSGGVRSRTSYPITRRRLPRLLLGLR